MFYSHEILTQRKYGIATVWLAATIGISKRSGLKRFPRREILSVSIPDACQTVVHTPAPLALRLQSNLLVGISRVYLQQFDYLYQDVMNAHANIRRSYDVEKRLEDINLPAKARTARDGDGLVLHDRPGFDLEMFPEFELDIMGEGMKGLEEELRALSDVGELMASGGSRTPMRLEEEFSGLPGTSPGSLGGFASSIGGRTGLMSSPPMAMARQYEGVLEEDPLFEFGEDGEMRNVLPGGMQTPIKAGTVQPGVMSEDLAAQVLRELGEGDQSLEALPAQELAFPQDPDAPMPDAPTVEAPLPDIFEHADPDAQPEEQERAHRVPRTRKPRIILDETNRLSHSQMKSWSDNYLENMTEATARNAHLKAARQAKPIANTLVLEHGIGGALVSPALAELFSGRAILSHIAEKTAPTTDQPGPGAEEQARGVRGATAGITSDLRGLDLGPGTLADLPGDIPSELGRDAEATGLDTTNPFPWLQTPSRTAPFSPGGPGTASSDPNTPFPELPLSSKRPSPRIPASIRRGRERMSVLHSVAEEAELDFPAGAPSSPGFDAFEFFGPAADAATQDVGSKAWLDAQLEKESMAFLEYVRQAVEGKVREQEEMGEVAEGVHTVEFEELVRPERDARMVAAQGLGHVLLLATRGIVYVSQEVPFAEIQIALVD